MVVLASLAAGVNVRPARAAKGVIAGRAPLYGNLGMEKYSGCSLAWRGEGQAEGEMKIRISYRNREISIPRLQTRTIALFTLLNIV